MGTKTCGDPGAEISRSSGADVAEGLCQDQVSSTMETLAVSMFVIRLYVLGTCGKHAYNVP